MSEEVKKERVTNEEATVEAEKEIPRFDLDRSDPGFKAEVAARPGGEGIMKCYACGACSAVCPVERQDPDFDPRKLIRMVILGMKEEVLKSPHIWRCSTCYTCLETCPQKVGFTEVLFVLKNMSAEAGCQPPGMSAQAELLKDHGRLYEITDFENEKRTELGLPPLPEKPEDFQKILAGFKLGERGEDQ